MRHQSEAKIAYRKARSFVFGDCELSRIEKLDAAKRLRTKIRALAARDGDPINVANDAIRRVRREMQIAGRRGMWSRQIDE
jgi:hypothetical protein